jgi:hypothetical protein
MKTETFQLHGNSSVCAGAFQLLYGRAPAQLRGNITYCKSILLAGNIDLTLRLKYVSTLGPNVLLVPASTDLQVIIFVTFARLRLVSCSIA